MLMNRCFDGIAFDLDGTLYPNFRLNLRIIPFLLKEFPLLWAMGKARNQIRADTEAYPPEFDFYDLQAQFMAKILRQPPGVIKDKTETLIYRGWEPLFTYIAPFPGVREMLRAFKEQGFKLGLLSDFPPEVKLANMGLGGYWDVILCSESTGRLKPHPLPFLELSERMGVPPERILYVGNNTSYDIIGAKEAGMKAALITFSIIKKLYPPGNADFVFSDYRQLSKYVIRCY
jgi:putative hydrolase of the HAD superfamily